MVGKLLKLLINKLTNGSVPQTKKIIIKISTHRKAVLLSKITDEQLPLNPMNKDKEVFKSYKEQKSFAYSLLILI
jgi:hypothetical protein